MDRQVRELLARSRAFHALPAKDRDDLVASTAQIATRMVAHELGGAAAPREYTAQRRVPDDPYALAFADPMDPTAMDPTGMGPTPTVPVSTNGVPAPGGAVPADRWRPDERFRAEGIAAGVTQVGRMIKEVDFPAFVASLVKGTFQAVVDASIQQMKAYGELVKSVAQSLNDFADDNVGDGESQKKLASKYPHVFEIGDDEKSGASKLKVKDDFDEDAMPNFMADLGLDAPVTDLEDPDSLQKLITGAKLEVARGRQQLLATTILMGMNRIIVTDGKINAKLKFNFTASDTMTRHGTVKDYDMQKAVFDGEGSTAQGYLKGRFEQPVPILVSATAGDSAATIAADAHLTGEVSLNFRSETFPLEKMTTSGQLFQLNQAQSGARGVPATPVATSPAAPATAPATPPTRPTTPTAGP
ncbi:MAG: hypothetical protein E6J91_19115 [Deltaproteobacteria bacterium]|nr:MAG: hypothetical protein E6J91_19115 [Deltaproteobacteria bacterium]